MPVVVPECCPMSPLKSCFKNLVPRFVICILCTAELNQDAFNARVAQSFVNKTAESLNNALLAREELSTLLALDINLYPSKLAFQLRYVQYIISRSKQWYARWNVFKNLWNYLISLSVW